MAARRQKIANPSSLIEYHHLRFLIIDAVSILCCTHGIYGNCGCSLAIACEASSTSNSTPSCSQPTDANISAYVTEAKTHGTVSVVRACEPTYNPQPFSASGIKVVEAAFPDGQPPGDSVVETWLTEVRTALPKAAPAGGKQPAVAVHCVAGLGRAPVLVAIALIEEGLTPLEAVELIRQKRRGAINASQLKFLQHEYTPRSGGGCCTIQ
jgi:protein tyrosine phosphatase type 4A